VRNFPGTSRCKVALLVCATLLLAAPARAESADAGTIRERLVEAVRTNPELHGSWVKVGRARQGKGLEFTLILDRNPARAAVQQRELTRLIQSLKPDEEYQIVEGPTLPVSQLLADLQARIESNLELGGVLIRDAYLTEADGRLRLVLLGRIAEDYQREAIVSACQDLMKKDPAWADVTPVQDQLRVTPLSAVAAEQMFVTGLRAFWNCDYAEAARAFTEAIVDAPDRVEYHYWRIVLEIVNGELARAYNHLKPWVQRRMDMRVPLPYPRVALSLERIQGPIRQQLSELELRAMRDSR
jgi:hypothetical protein